MMLSPRRLFFGTGTALVSGALLAAIVGGRSIAPDVGHQASVATRQLDSIAAGERDSTRALSLAYVERARLGLGSPFRLVDLAMHDPRLPDSVRSIVAWAIIGRVLDRTAYEVDPAVLDILGPPGTGADHLALIERVVATSDPRIAETTLRLAYGLASAQSTLSPVTIPVATEVIALVRDRALAARDLRRAIPRADANGRSLIDELIRMRGDRALDVERPLLAATTAAERNEAIDATPDVLRQIEAIRPHPVAETRVHGSAIDAQTAVIVSRLAARLPPLAATRIAVNSRWSFLRADTTLDDPSARFLLSATNEESLVAAYAYASRSGSARSVAVSRAMIATAVALRTLAQERVWFPGDATPTAGEIAGRFGLRAIVFDADVPRQWRPYYVRMVESALDDMRRVFPAYEPTSLTIRVGMRTLPDSALAMHDPRTHTLRLSAMTATGTLAHELAHDLDWQAARRLFSRAGGYATDRTLTEKGGALASSMRGLAAARVVGRGKPSTRATERPAEVFARGADWFVADALAQLGRSNGYLTAIEDQLVAGFAASAPDAASRDGATALVSGMGEMTYLPDSVGRSYIGRWQSLDQLDPAAVMVRMLEAPVSMRRGFSWPFSFWPSGPVQLAPSSLCRLQKLAEGSAYDRLMALTIEARATGILLRRARQTPDSSRPAWAHAALGDILWDSSAADDMRNRATAAVLEGAGRAGLIDLPPSPFPPAC